MGLLDQSCTEGRARKNKCCLLPRIKYVFQQSFISKILNFPLLVLLLSVTINTHPTGYEKELLCVNWAVLSNPCFGHPVVSDFGEGPRCSEVRFHRKLRFSFLNSVKFLSNVNPFEVRLICQHGIKFRELQSSLCCRGHPGEAPYCKKKWEYDQNILTSLVSKVVHTFSHFVNIHLSYALDI